jgi:hypothetical protein
LVGGSKLDSSEVLSYIFAMATFPHKGSDTPSWHSLARVDSLVLGTVNAPFKHAVDAEVLTTCLKTGDVAPWIVHVATLFTDVDPKLVLSFAREHGVSGAQLARTYHAVKQQTGVESAALETSLVPLAQPA